MDEGSILSTIQNRNRINHHKTTTLIRRTLYDISIKHVEKFISSIQIPYIKSAIVIVK